MKKKKKRFLENGPQSRKSGAGGEKKKLRPKTSDTHDIDWPTPGVLDKISG